MKKYLVILFIFILLPINVHGEELTISDLKLVSNTSTSSVLQEPGIDKLNINFDFSFKKPNDAIKYSFVVHNISNESYQIKLTGNSNKDIEYKLSTNTINKNGDTYIELTTTYNGDHKLSADRHEDSSVNISLLNVVNNNKIDSKIIYGIIGALLIGVSIIFFKLSKKLIILIPFIGIAMFTIIPTSISSPLISINSNITLLKNHYCNSFSEDEWSQISHNINNDNTSCYNIGDTREIVLENMGTYTVRIVNINDCNENLTSCGFVLEFTDIINVIAMNDDTIDNQTGWKDSTIRMYLNDVVFNSMPLELRKVITETSIVTEEEVIKDKLYLPSQNDLFITEENQNVFEYYKNNQVFDKKYNDEVLPIWTRDKFQYAKLYGSIENNEFNYSEETNIYGISPVFKIK